MLRQIFRYSFGFVLVLLCFAFVPTITASANTNVEGVVAVDKLNLRSSNSTSSSVVMSLKRGDKVVIKETQGDWYRVTAHGKDGFVFKQYIQVTAPKNNTPTTIETVVNVNGKPLPLEFEPPTVRVPGGQRILVPFRAISEALGIEVTWNQQTRQVTAIDRDTNKRVVFFIDDVNATVNGETVVLDAAPALTKNRTMLPLRFFSETFGAKVNWEQATRTANVNRIIKVEEYKEEVKSISAPLNLSGLQGRVTASVLNVRTGPTTTATVIDKLSLNQIVFVTGYTKEWLKVNVNGIEGFINGAYVELTDPNQQRVRALASPTYETQKNNQGKLTWSKLGGTTIQGSLVDNVFTITSNAILIEEIALVTEGIENITYVRNDTGINIHLHLREGYSAILHDTLASSSVSVYKKSSNTKRIVIDAGHGGKDPGAIANGLEEKEIILDVSLRLQKLLEQAGFQVLMTRTDDTFLELSERVDFANSHDADLFVSIHANSATNTSANGTETFWNSANSGPESKRLAEEIQAMLIEKLGTFNRGVKTANFQVIRTTKMPSALVELAFLTNKKDAEMMAKDEFRQTSAEAIFQGIMNYLK